MLVYMLMVDVHVRKGDYEEALGTLEMALSIDFKIKQEVEYAYYKSLCLNALGNHEESIIVLKKALNMPSIKDTVNREFNLI
jgi:tetratricopeptide (TPR) repeat protein